MANLSIFGRISPLIHSNKEAFQRVVSVTRRSASRHDNTIRNEALEKHRVSPLNTNPEKIYLNQASKQYRHEDVSMVNRYREKFPEFLPDPDWKYRDRITEMLEREEMFKRRKIIDIPEFYVGSVLAVTVSDKFAPGKSSRFVGICIRRSGHGLRHSFVLRNVIDDQGIEVMYEMYNPLLQKIEVLILEKRLDDELLYLRDCPLEHSYFPQDMEPQTIHEGTEVPVNKTKIALGPQPWCRKWYMYNLKGLEITGWVNEKVKTKLLKRSEHPQVKKEWEKDDIMKHYRESINTVESADILKQVNRNRKNWAKKSK
ncbi:39S ribosomal protein L19, mitochondrial-like [Mercenaria mercenaria]|uniref:39S ribosomal protein L19, mitochondrial-like n=1 Tax=Mercenaria mercenaria TaxID=6596 RepID=UPI001E1DE927|nr:39S ribosomal protein L19, mitochondrial-like [Mercenaria mercenaria]